MTNPTAATDVLLGAVTRHTAALGAIGVEMIEPAGFGGVDDSGRMFEIGVVFVADEGVTYAVPCSDATAVQMFEVLRQAEIAHLGGPVGPSWSRIDGGWIATVLEPIAGV